MGKLVAVSLFSSCGGGDLGAKQAGVDIVFANDIDGDSIKTYRKYQHLFADGQIDIRHADISNIKAFPTCDLVIGCYPCQSFTMGGTRSPKADPRSRLFKEFKRCIDDTNPTFFVTENVPGLAWLGAGSHVKEQIESFRAAGRGYEVSVELLNAKDFGVPQDRRRLVMVGVRKDVGSYYWFPKPAYGPPGGKLLTWESHGDAIMDLFSESDGEYYDYPKLPFSWWYMSRNRKRKWEDPSYAIQANWRHVPLHPASPSMEMVESRLDDGWKQKWVFTGGHDHLEGHPNRPMLDAPRRLSWRECAAIQTFPSGFEPCGSVQSKYSQVGNATPPVLMRAVLNGILDGAGLLHVPYETRSASLRRAISTQYSLDIDPKPILD